MSTRSANECAPILIELTPRSGVQQVSLARISPEELAQRSAQALDSAMDAVRRMADRMSVMIDGLAGNPDEVKLEFGLKLDVEGQALVAKAGAEGAIAVSLTWKRSGAAR